MHRYVARRKQGDPGVDLLRHRAPEIGRDHVLLCRDDGREGLLFRDLGDRPPRSPTRSLRQPASACESSRCGAFATASMITAATSVGFENIGTSLVSNSVVLALMRFAKKPSYLSIPWFRTSTSLHQQTARVSDVSRVFRHTSSWGLGISCSAIVAPTNTKVSPIPSSNRFPSRLLV